MTRIVQWGCMGVPKLEANGPCCLLMPSVSKKEYDALHINSQKVQAELDATKASLQSKVCVDPGYTRGVLVTAVTACGHCAVWSQSDELRAAQREIEVVRRDLMKVTSEKAALDARTQTAMKAMEQSHTVDMEEMRLELEVCHPLLLSRWTRAPLLLSSLGAPVDSCHVPCVAVVNSKPSSSGRRLGDRRPLPAKRAQRCPSTRR